MPSGGGRVGPFDNHDDAIDHLMTRGFRLIKGGLILYPADHDWTTDDNDAADYLFEEWDYGFTSEALLKE